MGNILQFRLRPEKRDNEVMYWMCDCGCATFYRLSNGSLECTRCEDIQDGYLFDLSG